VRNPGRSDGDARPDSIDPSTPQAGSAGGPADDVIAGVPASPGPADASGSTDDDLGALSDDSANLDDSPDFDDDLLFDPLLSDEPIDLAAVRADDALIDALGGGDLIGADDLVDPDDPLIAMLAAWAASARPEAEPASSIPDEPATVDEESTGAPLLRPVAETPVGGTAGTGFPSSPHPLPGGEPTDVDAGTADAGDTGVDDSDSRGSSDFPDLDLPTIRLPAAGLRPSALPRPHAGAGDPPRPVRLVGGTAAALPLTEAPVAGLLSHARRMRRRLRPAGQSLPPGHPLRRAAVAVVIAALGVSGAAASGGTALPGDPAWAMSKVFFAKRARSIEAAQVVSEGLERARLALFRRQTDIAARELAAINSALPSVGEKEGHTQLADQQRMLQAVLALTSPLPTDPNLTTTTTPTRPAHPDTSVLAQGAPPAADTEKADPDTAAPPVGTKPADPAGPAAADGTTTDGGATDPATGETGTTGTDTGTTDAETSGTGSTETGTTDAETTETGTTETGTTDAGTTETGTTETGTTGSETGTGTTGAVTGTETDTDETDTAPGDTGAPAADTGPAVSDPGPVLAATPDTARSAGTPADVAPEATAAESTAPSTVPDTAVPDTEPPPLPADEPARVFGALEPDAAAPVETEIDGSSPNPTGDEPDAARVAAEGSAPAVAASDTAEEPDAGAAGPVQPLRIIETGVVPEPVNIETGVDADVPAPDDTDNGEPGPAAGNEPSNEPSDDGATDDDSARGPAPGNSDDPEPVRVSVDVSAGEAGPAHVSGDADADEGPDDSRSGSAGDDNSGPGSGDDRDSSDDDSDDDSGRGGDDGGLAGARISAAVSIG
jgi:hypothetical protein